jgi:hypothetical protein
VRASTQNPSGTGDAFDEGHRTDTSEPGTVVLDIGGAIGAAVVYVDADLDGCEIEIHRAGSPWDGTHTAVRPRRLASRTTYAGVFESLATGRYELRRRGGDPTGIVVAIEVDGGTVTEARWPGARE